MTQIIEEPEKPPKIHNAAAAATPLFCRNEKGEWSPLSSGAGSTSELGAIMGCLPKAGKSVRE